MILFGTCALCREALQVGGTPALIKGYYWSILLIVTVPLVILGLGLRYAWRRYEGPATDFSNKSFNNPSSKL